MSTAPASPDSPAREAYTERLARAQAAAARLDRQSAHLANLRLVTFLCFATVLSLVVFDKLAKPWGFGAAASLAAFVGLAALHARVLAREARAKELVRLNERGLARLDGGWHHFPEHGGELAPAQHPYAGDLDLLGQGSLFQRLDDAGTVGGAARLAELLLSAAAAPLPSAAAVAERQAAVRELASRLDFRQRLVTEAHLAGEGRLDPSKLIGWVEGPARLAPIAWAWPVAHLLPPLTLGLGAAALFDAAPSIAFWVLLFAQLGLVALTARPLGAVYEAVAVGERGLLRFEDTFEAIAQERFESGRLQALQRGLADEGPPVPRRLARFSRLAGLAALRQSGLMHPIFNALCLWDVHVLFRLERWRHTEGAGVRRWFDALAEFEALSSLATLAFERPAWPFPVVHDGDAHLVATALAHPLLEAPVPNDVAFERPGTAWILTGSNMSGKTTLLRATGLNVVMALAGLPVCAASLRLAPMAVVSSMRVKDSLERGVSYFYAEVQRIKLILELAAGHPRASLVLLDELFMGTNTRERQIASMQLLRRLLDLGAVGALTTHDLSLCALEQERPDSVRNLHFCDRIVGGEMTFDYRLRAGVVQTSNALEVLRRAGVELGLPVGDARG